VRQILQHVGSTAAVPDLTALRTGMPLHGNRLIREEVVSLEKREDRPRGGSFVTSLLQLPWRVLFSRLRPAVAREQDVIVPRSPFR
jgi:hypothetical protein